MSARPFLLHVPTEILEHIALETALLDALGPPVHLVPLLCTCRAVHAALSRSPALLARIFKAKFDTSAARRRLGPAAVSARVLGGQLRVQCAALRRLRSGDVFARTAQRDLWTAFIMMLENDGRNAAQLIEYARVHEFVDAFVRARLWEGAADGWPPERDAGALALWLLWMTSTPELLRAEPPEQRRELIALLLPYVVGSFRYCAFHAPDTRHGLTRVAEPTAHRDTLAPAHGPYPPPPPPAHAAARLTHFGRRVVLARPLPAAAAALLHFARNEVRPVQPPPGAPADRAAARALGLGGPTVEDYAELNRHPHARLPGLGGWDWQDEVEGPEKWMRAPSARWDDDWERLRGCWDADPCAPPRAGDLAYTFGALDGLWAGKMLMPDEHAYFALVGGAGEDAVGEHSPRLALRFVHMRLREAHCVAPARALRSGDVRGAWFPPVKEAMGSEGTVTFLDLEKGSVHTYERFVRGRPNSHDEATCSHCVYMRAHPDAESEDLSDCEDDEECCEDACEGDVDMNVGEDSELVRLSPEEVAQLEAGFDEAGLYDGDDDDGGGSEWDDEEEGEWEVDEEVPKCTGFRDLVFTGETDARHGAAWGHFRYFGRLRMWDGLIAIVGLPAEPAHGTYVFRGYLHGGQNFSGRWRHAAHDLGAPPYEGTFTLSKVDEDA